MPLPITSKISKKGNLEIGGCDVADLRKIYQTPLYIMDIATIENRCRSYKKNFKFSDLDNEIIYASKAFISLAMCQLIKKEGLSIDVSTGGELYIAIRSGFDAAKIFFHGNNKSEYEILYALKNRVGFLIVDNFYELKILNTLCRKYNINQKIMLRITPGIKVLTNEYIQTGKIESKFGFSLHDNSAFEAVKKAIGSKNLNIVGFHAHIGSQIFNISCYEKLLEVMLKFVREVKSKLGIYISHLNIGGGLGIKYLPEDNPPTIYDFSRLIYSAVKKYEKKFKVKVEKIYLEPGRSIVGNSGVTIYSVGAIKEIAGVKNYISVDGGMSDNIRPMLYKAKYHAFIANKMNNLNNKNVKIQNKIYSIAGKHCESGDVLVEDINLGKVDAKDIIAVASTGAYCYSMASNYNGQPKSAVAAVQDGKSYIWIERQNYDDLIRGNKELHE